MKDCMMKTQAINNQIYTFLEKGVIKDEQEPKKFCTKFIKFIVCINILLLFIGTTILIHNGLENDINLANKFLKSILNNDNKKIIENNNFDNFNNEINATTIEPLETFQLDILNNINRKNNDSVESLMSEADTLRKQVLIEIRLADSMEGGWNEIIDSDVIILQKNANYLIVKYLFKDEDDTQNSNNQIYDNENLINKVENICNNLNWIMVKVYKESSNDLWNYKFISKFENEYKVLERWRLLINNIYDWKHRMSENNIILPNELPTLTDAIATNNQLLLKNNIDYKKQHNTGEPGDYNYDDNDDEDEDEDEDDGIDEINYDDNDEDKHEGENITFSHFDDSYDDTE